MSRLEPLVVATALAVISCGHATTQPKDGMAVLRQNRDAMFALKAYRAVCFTHITYDTPRKNGVKDRYDVSRLTAEKPTLMRYDSWPADAPPDFKHFVPPPGTPSLTFVCDGTEYFQQFGTHYRTTREFGPEKLHTILEPWGGFYSGKGSIATMLAEPQSGETVEVSYDGFDIVDGVRCDKVKVHDLSRFQEQSQDLNGTYYIGEADHLVRRFVCHIGFNGPDGYTRDATIHRIELRPKIDRASYKYTPPPTVQFEETVKDVPLLANGTVAPGFEALDAAKKSVKLSDLRGKVVVIDFWASWCGPCRASMPHTNEVVDKLAGEGLPVVALAVDDGEAWAAFSAWVATNQSQYAKLRFVFSEPSSGLSSKLYRVTGIPTQYVLDKQGVIQASFVGYGGPTSDLESAIRAAAGK